MTQPTTCPACGGLNHCALANASQTPCWCFTAQVHPAALAALPEAQRNLACLCPRCVLAVNEASDEAKRAD